MSNLVFASEQIARHFAVHRITWEQLYPSEKWIFERLASDRRLGSILDVGCAAGGLATALGTRFALDSYVGIDSSVPAIDAARSRAGYPCEVEFVASDILDVSLGGRRFETVVSLACADWNIETRSIIEKCWSFVQPGGDLVISLRLTNGSGINDFARSYQDFKASASEPSERTNYVVMNVVEALTALRSLDSTPAKVVGYGYWGRPSPSAVTPFERLVFAVFAVRRRRDDDAPGEPQCELHVPLDLL